MNTSVTRKRIIVSAAAAALAGLSFAGAASASGGSEPVREPIYSTSATSPKLNLGYGSVEIRCDKDYKAINHHSSARLMVNDQDPGTSYDTSYEYRVDRLAPTTYYGEGFRIYRKDVRHPQQYLAFRIKATITCAHKDSFHP
ncbi:hypothetical protein ACF08N_36230 [Streptomyces sp. NPDC015127]|uniref:hypothetical protein n=1 Tax=Streptomyces sp. NPDC015127 TaxID=3364939 RepID=UPI0036F5BA24